jgi:predicted protein tyrosine phosphatase
MRTREDPEELHWVAVGAGRLTLWHRPGHGAFAAIAAAGCTHVVTLLSDREGGPSIGVAAKEAGLGWVWLPMPNSDEPVGDARAALEVGLGELSRLLDGGAALLIHCSAGIHRTGMIAYALLRSRGLSRDDALAVLSAARHHTREGVKARHLRWGDALAATPSA